MKRFFIIILLVVTTAACGTRQVAATVARPIAAETVAPTQVADDLPAPTLVPTATPTPACAELKGRLVKETYPGAVTNKEIPVNIYLPACFDEAKSYPVLYLLHGQPADANFWVSEGVADAADKVNA